MNEEDISLENNDKPFTADSTEVRISWPGFEYSWQNVKSLKWSETPIAGEDGKVICVRRTVSFTTEGEA